VTFEGLDRLPVASTARGAILALPHSGGRGLRVHLHEEIAASPAADRRAQATAMSQALADVFTDPIRRPPQDWHVLQPVWPPAADLDRRPATAVEPSTVDHGLPADAEPAALHPGGDNTVSPPNAS
jgi:lauroyl/myristoyl acyltransferase